MIKMQLWATLISILAFTAVTAQAADLKPLPGQKELRVCADPHNLPYSNDKLEGFDNKIAALLGKELGLPVVYTWFPQRIGFARNTIKKVDVKEGRYLCDVAFSMPTKTDFLATTKPYYKSIQSMVYRQGEGYELKTVEDIAKVNKTHKLKIGIFDRGVMTAELIKLGLGDQLQYFQMMPGDGRVNGGRIITDELAKGKIDVAFVWGPVGGYYASQTNVPMVVQPLNELGKKFEFHFSMGTRYPDKQWRQLLNDFIAKDKKQIDDIISQYHMPSLNHVQKVGDIEVGNGAL